MIKKRQKLNINSKFYKKIIGCLNDAAGKPSSRLVGGCVRDAIINKVNKDIDIATSLEPTQVMQALNAVKIKTIPTGLKFGTVTALYKGEQFEITTLRRDVSCDGRRAEVAFSYDFKEDAMRRDFTINAISYDPIEEVLYDYFTGIEDLENKIVRFIGDASARIKEDYLRILRFFRFSAIYANKFDEQSLSAAYELKDNIKKLARERILDEMGKMLTKAKNSSDVLQAMVDNGIFKIIFDIDYIDCGVFRKLGQFSEKYNIAIELESKYALFFLNETNLEVRDLMEFKFSRLQANKIFSINKNIAKLRRNPKLEQEIIFRELWFYRGFECLQYILISLASGVIDENQAKKLIGIYQEKEPLAFPVNGEDLKTLGISGKAIGSTLDEIKDRWIRSDFALEKEELIRTCLHSLRIKGFKYNF